MELLEQETRDSQVVLDVRTSDDELAARRSLRAQISKLAAVAGAYFLVLHQLEANVLVPKIMENRVGVSPVIVIVALLIGGELWGLVGAILAVPTAAIITAIVSEVSGEAPA